MADRRGTIEQLTNELGSAFAAIQQVLEVDKFSSLLLELGLDNPPSVGAQLAQKLDDAGAQCGNLAAAIEDLIDQSEKGNNDGILAAVATIIEAVGKLIADLEAVATDLKLLTAGSPDAANIAAFADQMVKRLLEAAVVRYLEEVHPVVERILALLTIIEVTPLPPPPAEPPVEPPPDPPGDADEVFLDAAPPILFARRRLYLDRIGPLFQDPLGLLSTAYKWGDKSFDGKRLFLAVSGLFDALGIFSLYDELGDAADGELSFLSLSFGPTKDKNIIPPGIEGQLYADLEESAQLTLARPGENWRLALELSGKFGAGLGMRLLPPARLEIVPPAGTVEGRTGLSLIGESADQADYFVIFGEADGSRLQAKRVQAGLLVGFEWDIKTGTAKADVGFEAKFVQGKLIIDTSKSDGFLQKILPSGGLTADFDFDLGWTAERGFFFTGSAGLETSFALNRTLGPFRLDALNLLLAVASDKLRIETTLDGSATIGPVSTAVSRIGLAVDLKFTPGNLGEVDLSLGFKPPSGLGIVIEAGPITGGGFISFDFENQRYAGVLQLKLYSIGVTAIGLLDTKLPGGQSGFSFLIIIAVEFTPIQLGFGFTLNGVGGLAGIYRTIITQALREGLRQKSLDSILFPPEPVKRATQLISDLRRVFPPAENRYVFGPMLKIGWETFLEASLGVILDVPSPVRIIILGQLDVLMPERHAPIVELHLDVLGIIDFGEKLFSLDASLYDSRVALFNISGDMAIRLSWGDNPSFALSVGGFNPHFQPPPNFPTLRRLCISLGYEDNPRLALEAYFAVTSNSFQFGASLSLYAELGPLVIKGFMGFDALFIFQPFSFIIDFQAGLDLSLGPFRLLGIYLAATLSGPTPYHIIGEAKVSILFIEISAHVDFTFGEEKHESVPGADPWPLLEAAIADQRNWSASLPPASVAVVTLAAPEGSQAPVLIDPLGGATLRQKVVPFNQRLTKFGEAAPKNHELFQLSEVKVGTTTLPTSSPQIKLVNDHFAPGQFREMTDAEKISSPSFVDMTSGFTLASDALTVGGGTEAKVEYTTKVIDTKNAASIEAGVHSVDSAKLLQMLQRGQGCELASAGLSKYAPSPNDPKLVALTEELFVVAQKTDLKVRTDITRPVSKGLAQLALADYLGRKPLEREILQVIPRADIEEAA